MLKVDGERLWNRLLEMGRLGATAGGGCNRPALGEEDGAARALFAHWCTGAGLEVRTDAIGNLFARRAGRVPDAPAVLVGSHLDTQPTGGRFDGVYGVLAGLEVLETLADRGIVTEAPVEVVNWTNEEGARFPVAMMGSAVWAGRLPLEIALSLRDHAGHTVAAELERLGARGPLEARHDAIGAAFELHIEQGPILEAEGATIGIVTGVQHMCRYQIAVRGQAAHAGTTPPALRRDPMRALSRFLPRLYAAAARMGDDLRLTFGVIRAEPGSPNTIPGRLTLSADIRHPDAARYAEFTRDFVVIVEAACRECDLECEVRRTWESPGVDFDPACIAAVRDAAAACGYHAREIVSGAGHDACNVAQVVPTAMIFIPCAGGLSHNEAESASPADVAAGANVLLHAVLARAGRRH